MKQRTYGFKTIMVGMALLSTFWVSSPAAAGPGKTFTNSIGIEFMLIPAGSFMMGADKHFEDAADNETPRHKVNISKPYYLGKYEVTQEQWVAVMESYPSEFKARKRPVEMVSWNHVQMFIHKLNLKEGTQKYRLPTEAEWEYAARAGSSEKYCFGDDEGRLSQYAWYNRNSGKKTQPVGQLKPNAWGLYDMHGNVYEWVMDRYDENYYSKSPSTDPEGPSSGSSRVIRGGCWLLSAGDCRSAHRTGFSPGDRHSTVGFRLAISPSQ
jgi:formylglycine-generating enzyme required for sulfatase activity